MYETVNDSFKIVYNQDTLAREAQYRAEILDRILNVTAGFSAETFDMDFAFNIPISSTSKALSLYKNGQETYIGIYDRDKKIVSLETNLSVLRKVNQNTIDGLLLQLHANEKYSNQTHSYYKSLNMPNVKNAWHRCLSLTQNKYIKPTLRNSINVNKKEMSVRQFYDISVATPREEFACWILSKNPSEEEKRSRMSVVIDKICEELEKRDVLTSVSEGLRSIQRKIDDYER